MTPSWYDVLDVDPQASSEEIRAAWKASIADLDPADRRFKSRSTAAEVLLDPERRAAHDADLATGDAAHDDADAGVTTSAPAPARREPRPERPRAPSRLAATAAAVRARRTDRKASAEAAGTRRGRLWLLPVVLGVLALVLVAVTAVALTRGSDGPPLPDEDDVAAARSAAEAAVVPILSYDYRSMDDDQAAAGQFMTDSYRENEYDPLFAVLKDNAPRLKAVVNTELLSSGIVRTGPDQVDVLAFVNRPTQNAQVTRISRDQVLLQMVRQDDRWLVGCLITVPGGTCGD